MSRATVDHQWTRIYDLHSEYIGRIAVREKVDEVGRVLDKLERVEQTEAIKKLYAELHRIQTALIRCQQFIYKELELTHDDLHINYRFATDSMNRIQSEVVEFIEGWEAALRSPA
ncbi:MULTISPECIES: hypothetical protein [Pseudomonas]|uniref:Uncharacterized protein n=1 Tax=Pseudomonas maumuensis TaxID=2842354 RepID=A0ABX8NE70_9PSED|nr:hypothetical protein [Pseudomonas maumuensis]QXH54665.1 hypothetical protein KSS90_14965 [Pseudomonas maumuensis]